MISKFRYRRKCNVNNHLATYLLFVDLHCPQVKSTNNDHQRMKNRSFR